MNFDTTQLFDKQSKKLFKRYKNLKDEIHQSATSIKNQIYKVRIANSNKNKGKRSGYRIYYYLKLENMTYLLTIYDKSDTAMIDESLLIDMVENL